MNNVATIKYTLQTHHCHGKLIAAGVVKTCFESRSDWNSNLCLDVKHADTTNGNRICWLHHCCGRSRAAQKWTHSSHLVAGAVLLSDAGSWQDDELTEEEIMRHHKQQDQCNTARKRFNSARTQ